MAKVTEDIVSKLEAQGALKKALLSEALGNGRVGCNICQRRCRIEPGGVGVLSNEDKPRWCAL